MRFPPTTRGGACRLLLLVALVVALFPRQMANAAEPSNVVGVTAELETTPVIGSGDAADDPAVWVDPVDPSRSLVFGNDKDGRALEIYDLNGTRLGRITDGGGFFGNVDVRYGFPLAGGLVDIVAVNRGGVRIYKIDPATRTLSNITDGGSVPSGVSGEGLCLYHSARTGEFGVVTIARSGEVRHLDLRDADNDGLIDGVVRRSWAIGSEAEGCVFDDELGHLYIAEEDRGIWKYGAEPTDPVDPGSRTRVDVIGSGGNVVSDVEGLAIVARPGGTGYLIASAQNVADPTLSYFTVYRREGGNAYVGAFRVTDGPNTDACSRTDGIEAVAVPLGPRFPQGVFICQDDANTAPGSAGNQNFKLVRLERAVDLGDDPPPPPPPDGEISVVGSTSDSSPDPRTSITIAQPAGTVAGDVLVASIGIVDDDPTYQAPSGWARVRAESIGNRLRVETFVKVAGGSEPSAYTWTLPDWRRIAGGITAYRGVDGTSPVDAHAATVHQSDGTAVTAPSVTTSVPEAMLVHVAVVNAEAAISPPAGMTEAWEATGWRAGSSRDVTISSSHVRHPSSGATGERTAQSSVAGHRIGVLLALRPAPGSGGDTTPPETTITSGPTGTVASDSADFAFSSNEVGSTFVCRLDAGFPEPCTSPQSYSGLADGEHTFDVTATDPAGNTDPTPASRTWIVDSGEPPPPPDGEITVVGSASNSSPDARTNITIGRPAGTSAGDVLVAAIAIVDDDPSYQAPAGWSRVRSDTIHDGLRVEVFAKTTGNSEPAAYTWTLPDWRRIAGGITAFRGVDGTAPVDTHGALADSASGTAVTAPSITTSLAGTMLVHVAVINAEAALDPPAGMDEAWEATGWRAGSPRDVTLSSSFAPQPTSGATGERTATASAAGARIGVLLALRPGVPPGPDTTPPETTITSGPTGTVTTDSATFTFTSSEAGSTFVCQLDADDPEPCTSPRAYTGLDDGEHTFSVRATDPAGNTDPTSAARAWTVDTSTPSGLISTIAGTGVRSSGGDGGPATSAGLNAPRTMASDAAGNLYIADTENHRIRRVGTDGVISTIAGTGLAGYSGDGGPATAARLNNPHGVVVDAAGNVFIADPPNQRIRRIGTDGDITTVAGTGTSGYNGDGIPATAARLNYPKGIEVGPDGALYIGDANNHRVRRVGPDGIITTIAGTGVSGFSGDGGPATAARLNKPRNVAFDPAGNLLIADDENHRVRRVTVDGIITTVAGNGTAGDGGDGGPATGAHLGRVRDVAVDPAGNVYIADQENHRVRRVDPAGVITTVAGAGDGGFSGDGGPAEAARVAGPRGVAVDPHGRLLIADTGNHRIRRVS